MDPLAGAMVGPPDPRPEWDNLPEVVQLPTKRKAGADLLRALLTAAQLGDLAITEKGLATPTRQVTAEEIQSIGGDPSKPQDYKIAPFAEKNPLPGMQHPAGRAAWGVAENVGLTELRKRNPKIGVPATVGAILAHALLAEKWRRNINKYGAR